MSQHLEAIRDSVAQLIETIEAAGEARLDDDGDADGRRAVRMIGRHPVLYAIGLFGVGLVGSYLLGRAKRRPPTTITTTACPPTWWNPPDSTGAVH
ncbi:MAG TPA: hypothetical protein VFQ53_34780 [Kofleriaceae bacterium]|nr:hypothetical protein [Kofleriaceae bacterium]